MRGARISGGSGVASRCGRRAWRMRRAGAHLVSKKVPGTVPSRAERACNARTGEERGTRERTLAKLQRPLVRRGRVGPLAERRRDILARGRGAISRVEELVVRPDLREVPARREEGGGERRPAARRRRRAGAGVRGAGGAERLGDGVAHGGCAIDETWRVGGIGSGILGFERCGLRFLKTSRPTRSRETKSVNYASATQRWRVQLFSRR